MRRGVFGVVACVLAIVAAACGGSGAERTGDRERSGGAGTVDDATGFAFALALKTLRGKDRRAFAVGNSFFNRNWVRAPRLDDGPRRARPDLQRAVVLVLSSARRARPPAR